MSSTQRSLQTRTRQQLDQHMVLGMTISLLCRFAEHDPYGASGYFDRVFYDRSQVDALRSMLKGTAYEADLPRLDAVAEITSQAAAAGAERVEAKINSELVALHQAREQYDEQQRVEMRRRARAAGRT